MAGIVWYGPLIDLCTASSHVDDFVQLIVFVHQSNPVEYKLARGGNVVRTDIQVGDETRPFFSVTLWNKHLAASVSAGDIILLQNVKVTKFGSTIEAKTVQYSSVLCLVHPYLSLLSKGVDELMGSCRVGGTAKEKLRRVIDWVQRTRSTLCNEVKGDHVHTPAIRNWKVHEEQESRKCYLLSEVLQLGNSCKAIFYASVGEIFLPSAGHDSETERMFLSRWLSSRTDNVVEDLICTGCQLCGSPLCSESRGAQQAVAPLYCKRSSNRLHTVGLIYKPFMLYVWDNWHYIPLLVTHKAAEVLFGNIRAEKVHQSYNSQNSAAAKLHELKAAKKEVMKSCSSGKPVASGSSSKNQCVKIPNFYLIWLILLKMLLLQGKNTPFKFEALVDPSLEMEDGRFEMIGVSMPYSNTNVFTEAL